MEKLKRETSEIKYKKKIEREVERESRKFFFCFIYLLVTNFYKKKICMEKNCFLFLESLNRSV